MQARRRFPSGPASRSPQPSDRPLSPSSLGTPQKTTWPEKAARQPPPFLWPCCRFQRNQSSIQVRYGYFQDNLAEHLLELPRAPDRRDCHGCFSTTLSKSSRVAPLSNHARRLQRVSPMHSSAWCPAIDKASPGSWSELP